MLSTKIWLEANTERSESNPGRSLGYYESKGELSGRQYHHHILAHTIEDRMNYKSAHSPLARSPRSKSITDNADATDLFFHGFLLCVVGFLCACRAQLLSRIISCWRLSCAV